MPLRATAVAGERRRPSDPDLLRTALDPARPALYEDRDRAGPATEPEPSGPDVTEVAC